MNGNGKWTGRKIVGFLVVFFAATIFFAVRYIESGQWIEFVKWLFLIFVAGNGLEHIAQAWQKVKGGGTQ